MAYFAVIDTETNWADQVMSIGTVIAHSRDFAFVDAKYHVLTPEYEIGGMYEDALFAKCQLTPSICRREDVIAQLKSWFADYGVEAIFAYNASFDRNHLPELRCYTWYDIMRLAAYRQYNSHIPACADCFSTGRLKRGYGVEAMLRLLSQSRSYHETHNAITDALDELQIMRLLGHCFEDYLPL